MLRFFAKWGNGTATAGRWAGGLGGAAAVFAGLVLGAGLRADEVSPSARCLECHTDAAEMAKVPGGRGVQLLVDREAMAATPHGEYDCTDCHEGLDGTMTPHRENPVPVDCTSCHEKPGKKHAFHRRLSLSPLPEGEDTSCTACHGGHNVAAVKSPQFALNRRQLTAGCGQCHEAAKEHFVASAHGKALTQQAENAPNCLTCHKDPAVAAPHEAPDLRQKQRQTQLCESCHVEKPAVASQTLRGTKFVSSFDRSVHGAALAGGDAKSANCVDCHGAHEMNRALSAGARVNKLHQPDTCARCHEKEAAAFAESVHAVALKRGNADSPVCTDCHGEHDIRGHKDPLSPVNAANVARQVCASCHASLRLTQKYGLSAQSFQTFADSYHGLAARGGAVEVVNCASCHSVHAIKSSLDPTSTIHKSNLVRTCGECHPGANTRFTVGAVHVNPSAAEGAAGGDPLLYLIASLYTVLIVVVVGGMGAHNLLDFLKKLRRKLAIQKGLIEPERLPHRLYLRMSVHERLQHATLVLSFVVLVVTGFMLRYPEAWWVVAIRHLSVHAFEWRGYLHREAGVILLAAGAWHVAYLAFAPRGRELFFALLPRRRDFTDPWHVLRYNLGLAPTKPAFPRFSYVEKAEYWALVWGTLLMSVTGAVLWFDNTSMGLITKLGFDVSRTIHFYEAVLATLAIVVWHFYFVIFNPDVYPMNLAWLTGRMSEEEMHEEHPLELARLKAEEAAATAKAPGDGPGPDAPDRSPPAGS